MAKQQKNVPAEQAKERLSEATRETTQQNMFEETDSIEKNIVYSVVGLFEFEKQNLTIAARENNGYKHYESLVIPMSGEVLLRFRKVK